MDFDEDPRAERARELRRVGRSLRQIREEIGPVGNDRLRCWLAGVPPAEWTRRPAAKDELRVRARDLRSQGGRVQEIAAELGVSKSSVSLWVRDLPAPAPRSVEHVRMMSERRWAPVRRRRNIERLVTKARASASVGRVTERELYLIGVALYWAEGAKDKPYSRRERVTFCNSDPTMVTTFLSWLLLMGVESDRLRFRLQIHETADAKAAMHYWSDVVGHPLTSFTATSLKRHDPRTNRLHRGESYQGCLTVHVLRSADLYRQLEGAWFGVAAALTAPARSQPIH